MRKNILISILSAIIVMTGCKKIDSMGVQQPDPYGPPLVTPIGIPVGSPISKTIGSTGGSLISPDGKMELNFPVGALSANTAISIQPVTNFCPGGLGLAYHLMPDNIKFSKPVTLTYHYTDDDVDGSHPYFLYIAYQDSSQAWKANNKARNVDTIAKTVSLGITHFSIWSLGDNLVLHLDPYDDNVFENETREITVVETLPVAGSDPNDDLYLPQLTRLPDKAVRRWTLVGSASGIGANGTLSAISNTSKVTYTAPSTINNNRTVQVSAEIDYSIVFFNNGKQIASVNRLILFKNIKLLPSKFDYNVVINYVDSAVAGWYPGQVYEDKASFDLTLKKTKDSRGITKVEVVRPFNPKNSAPSVTPSTQTYRDPYNFSTTTWEWIPDDIGVMNITDVEVTDFDEITNAVSLKFVHKGTMHEGANVSTSISGPLPPRPPKPFGGSDGMPDFLQMKLTRQPQSFHWIKVTPK